MVFQEVAGSAEEVIAASAELSAEEVIAASAVLAASELAADPSVGKDPPAHPTPAQLPSLHLMPDDAQADSELQ
eukprot:797354-Rhodomonas_salina.2